MPYELNFNTNHGKILDKNGIGTGFTWIAGGANGGYLQQNLAVTSGTLKIASTAGSAYLANNSQDNMLGVGIDAPSQINVLSTTLINPPAGLGKSEQAGLWFGNDQDNYVKLDVISMQSGTKIEYVMEVGGVEVARRERGPFNLSNATVTLKLYANPSDKKIRAVYGINSDPVNGPFESITSYVAPPEFFSFDAAGTDQSIGTRTFGGVFATHRFGSQLTYTFDDFSVVSGSPPPPPSDFNFTRKHFPVPYPTAMVWGPDNKLYVTEMTGTIHQLTFDSAMNVIADNPITTIGYRLTLGITVDPASTPDNVILWVSHSNPPDENGNVYNGQVNSGVVTRLSGPGFTTRNDVITGLPRAQADHSVNAVHFGPDEKLYVSVGGNTGAGAPNQAGSPFGDRPEQPLSAALLVADVYAPGFEGKCDMPLGSDLKDKPATCDVEVYATGLRNMYDFVWHSNGNLYGPVNGLGVMGTYPPSTTMPGCKDFGDPRYYTEGGNNPGEQPDIFVKIDQGKYYGHPNPYRNGFGWPAECVFMNGAYQGVPPLSNYVPAMLILGHHRSANGTIEYGSDAFGGRLKGEILIANYSIGDDIIRIRLNDDGQSVAETSELIGGFNDPLPLAQAPNGTIFVGEMGTPHEGEWFTGQVTALVPAAPAAPADTTAPAVPSGVVATGTTSGISLDWSDNTEPDLAGYHVYRSDQPDGTFTRITASPVTTSTYLDAEAPAGTTSYYRVTAIDTTGNESAPSNTASAARPGETGIESLPAMERTWARTDKPVVELAVERTWMWGPEPFTAVLEEEYHDSPGGSRQVQYFDKSRMEINDPSAVDDGLWYVTNGLLVKELITGAMQIGDDQFEQRTPAQVNVAGDPGTGPSYAVLGPRLTDLALPEGTPITQRLHADGSVTEDGSLAGRGVVAGHYEERTKHTVAEPFWTFMTSAGLVYEDGAYVEDALFVNPYYATGLPITEAYWTEVTVLGTPKDVLVQCFERRCLTYTPDNPAGWQVEAGNVGLHYFLWRYGSLPE